MSIFDKKLYRSYHYDASHIQDFNYIDNFQQGQILDPFKTQKDIPRNCIKINGHFYKLGELNFQEFKVQVDILLKKLNLQEQDKKALMAYIMKGSHQDGFMNTAETQVASMLAQKEVTPKADNRYIEFTVNQKNQIEIIEHFDLMGFMILDPETWIPTEIKPEKHAKVASFALKTVVSLDENKSISHEVDDFHIKVFDDNLAKKCIPPSNFKKLLSAIINHLRLVVNFFANLFGHSQRPDGTPKTTNQNTKNQ